jgi:signal transduction histidine kinase
LRQPEVVPRNHLHHNPIKTECWIVSVPPEDEREGPPGETAPDEQAERARCEELGRVAAELIHDLASTVEALQTRIRLAAGEARMGRLPLVEMDRVGETAAELGTMLRDVLEVARGAAISPEVAFDPGAVVERAIRRILPDTRPLELRLDSTLPDGARVPGRESFLARAVANLLQNAVRHAQSQVLVALSLDVGDDRRPRLLAAVEDDGPGLRRAAGPYGDAPQAVGLGLRSAAWAVQQLGGSISYARGRVLGGARFELLLPCRVPRAES